MKTCLNILALLLTAFVSLPAFGANVDIERPIPDLPLYNIPPMHSTGNAPSGGAWQFSVGGGVSYAPRYEGASSNRLRFIPLLDANDGHYFISALRGIGYNYSETGDVQYGLRIAPGRSRKESDDPHLAGMDNISFSPEAGLFFNHRFAPWYLSSDISIGSHGAHAELGGGIGFKLSASDRLRFGANLSWGDSKYNQTYFGVTAAEAAASNNVLSPYNASAGLKDYALTSNWLHYFTKEWFSSAGLSYKRLAESAQQSPLTLRSSMGSANILLGYRF